MRKCEADDFEVLTSPRKIDDASLKYKFCPGKATWYPGLYDLYEQCFVAMETGILPEGGSLQDQHCLFVEAFPAFCLRWKERTYKRVWADVDDYVVPILKAFSGKKGASGS